MIYGTWCPQCGKLVTYKWDKGFIPESHNTLVADCVYHAACWDELEKKYDVQSGPARSDL